MYGLRESPLHAKASTSAAPRPTPGYEEILPHIETVTPVDSTTPATDDTPIGTYEYLTFSIEENGSPARTAKPVNHMPTATYEDVSLPSDGRSSNSPRHHSRPQLDANEAPADTYDDITFPSNNPPMPPKTLPQYYAYALCNEDIDSKKVSAYAVGNIRQPVGDRQKSNSVSFVLDSHQASDRLRANSARAPQIPIKPVFLRQPASLNNTPGLKPTAIKKQRAEENSQNVPKKNSRSMRPPFRRSRSERAPKVPTKPKHLRARNSAPTSRLRGASKEKVKLDMTRSTEYSSLNPKEQYAILEPFTGSKPDTEQTGVSKKPEDYSHLEH